MILGFLRSIAYFVASIFMLLAGLFGRFGWKIKLSHNGALSSDRAQDRIKGSVFRATPWKSV